MSTDNYELAEIPTDTERRELWLQHAAGSILFENVRRYALGEIDPSASAEVRRAAEKAVDDCMYGLMMLIDGVTGGLCNSEYEVALSMVTRLVAREGDKIVQELDLRDGDGVCMGFHGWKEGDFGEDAVAVSDAETR